MQTFLPSPSFYNSAAILDMRRLGKQRVETKQIYLALTLPKYGWKNHPAVTMWKGYEVALAEYGKHICMEWISRGYNDSLLPFFINRTLNKQVMYPPWLGDPVFHASHRSNLLRKDPAFYSKYNWGDDPHDPYQWPVVDSTTNTYTLRTGD